MRKRMCGRRRMSVAAVRQDSDRALSESIDSVMRQVDANAQLIRVEQWARADSSHAIRSSAGPQAPVN